MTLITGIGLLLIALAAFSLFSMKAPKGSEAMSGLANAAVASFLVEAIHRYISGDLLNLSFLGEVGEMSGSMGGVAAAILVAMEMGVNPIFAVVAGVALGGYGILPGFIAGYAIGFVAPWLEKHLSAGVDVIVTALICAPLARIIAAIVAPAVDTGMGFIGGAITAATAQSPIIMGLLLGGIMKPICTSPLSAMALTAMLNLTGLPMGIAAIACVGGAISGLGAALLGIINNAPGTASPIPGLLAPFAFNDPLKVLLALAIAAIGGTIAGILFGFIFRRKYGQNEPMNEKLVGAHSF